MFLVPMKERVATCCGAIGFDPSKMTSTKDVDSFPEKYHPDWIIISKRILGRDHPFVKDVKNMKDGYCLPGSETPQKWDLVRTSKGFIPFRGWPAEMPAADVPLGPTSPIFSAPQVAKTNEFGDFWTIEGTYGLRTKENIKAALKPGVNMVIVTSANYGTVIPKEFGVLGNFGFKFVPISHNAYQAPNPPRRMLFGFYEA